MGAYTVCVWKIWVLDRVLSNLLLPANSKKVGDYGFLLYFPHISFPIIKFFLKTNTATWKQYLVTKNETEKFKQTEFKYTDTLTYSFKKADVFS